MNDKAGQSNGSYFPFPSKVFALCTCWYMQTVRASHDMILKLTLIVNSNFNVFLPREKRVFVLNIHGNLNTKSIWW